MWNKIKIGYEIKALEWWQSFSKNSHCDLDLDPIMLKRELVRGIVISNTCVKLYRNWIINEVTRAGEHTNERTYVLTYIRTGQTLYPLHNFVVRGDNYDWFNRHFDYTVTCHYCVENEIARPGRQQVINGGLYKTWYKELSDRRIHAFKDIWTQIEGELLAAARMYHA